MNPAAQDHPATLPATTLDRDSALAQAAGAGDEEARRLVARRLLGRVRTTVRYLCGDSPDHLDLVQECLLEILGSLACFRGESRLETWADRIVVRTSLRLLRRERRRTAGMVPDAPDAHEAHEAPDLQTPESDLLQARLRARVAVLYQKLDPERRTVVVLQVVHGYTLPEIAALTDTGLETVRSRFKLARQQLRRLVAADPDLREWAHLEEAP